MRIIKLRLSKEMTMKIKNLKLIAVVLLAGVLAHAEGAAFYPYSIGGFNAYDGSGSPVQNWIPAQMITLNVQAGSAVYLTNYVSAWYGDMPSLGDSGYAAGYDMSANKYGYVYAQKDADGKAVPVGEVHWSDGATKDITYQNPNGPQTRTTTGYLLDTFYDDAEIFFVMSPNGYDETVNGYEPVNDTDGDPAVYSILDSRQINTVDLAGNVRVNFGTVDGVGHEFVVGYEEAPPAGGMSGPPLPGLMLCGLLSIGTVAAASRLRRRRE